jgi:hypothetical protein
VCIREDPLCRHTLLVYPAFMWKRLTLCLMLSSCQPKEQVQPTSQPIQPIGAALVPKNLPQITTLEDIKKHAGEQAIIKGRFDVDRIKPIGKGGPFVYIVLSDQTHLVYQYSARHMDRAELAFVDKKVSILGKAYPNANQPPDVQQLMAPHIFPEKIELEVGETPYATAPTEIPALSIAENKAQLEARAGHWVQARGTLSNLQKSEYWVNATLTLADNTAIQVSSLRESLAKNFDGKSVLLVGMFVDGSFSGQIDLCDGALPSCEMPPLERQKTKKAIP